MTSRYDINDVLPVYFSDRAEEKMLEYMEASLSQDELTAHFLIANCKPSYFLLFFYPILDDSIFLKPQLVGPFSKKELQEYMTSQLAQELQQLPGSRPVPYRLDQVVEVSTDVLADNTFPLSKASIKALRQALDNKLFLSFLPDLYDRYALVRCGSHLLICRSSMEGVLNFDSVSEESEAGIKFSDTKIATFCKLHKLTSQISDSTKMPQYYDPEKVITIPNETPPGQYLESIGLWDRFVAQKNNFIITKQEKVMGHSIHVIRWYLYYHKPVNNMKGNFSGTNIEIPKEKDVSRVPTKLFNHIICRHPLQLGLPHEDALPQ